MENIIEKPMSNEEMSEYNLRKLAEFYKTNNRYPSDRKPEETKLAYWLKNKRSSKIGRRKEVIIYPGEEQLGIDLGLPPNWLNPQFDFLAERRKKISEDNIRKLADFYKTNNRYPNTGKPEERKLGRWFNRKRLAKKGIGEHKVYPGEEQLGIDLGLPTNWLNQQ